MAIITLSELSYTEEGVTSTLVSPYMKPIIHFKVSGAAGLVNPGAEVEFAGTNETVTFEAIYLKKEANEHYFMVDVSEIMKYLIKTFDRVNKPDDLEFLSGDLLQIFDEYFSNLDLDIYFERGTGNQQSSTVNNTWLCLADQIPSKSGFNLFKTYVLENLHDLKWSRDTYNALFFWNNADQLYITNKTNGKDLSGFGIFNSWINGTFLTFEAEGLSIVSGISAGNGMATLAPDYPITTGETIHITMNLKRNEGDPGSNPSIGVYCNDTPQQGYYLTEGINTFDYELLETGNLYILFSTNSASNISLTNVSVRISSVTAEVGFYQLKFKKDTTLLTEGVNEIEITSGSFTKTINIDYQPNCESTGVCWQDPRLGYVSYPFYLAKQTGVSSKAGDEYLKLLTTLKSVNTLKEITGYEETKKITLTARVDIKYWDILQTIYSSRHVYLFVGDSWIECIVSGGCNMNDGKIKSIFTVELTLPETFNIKL